MTVVVNDETLRHMRLGGIKGSAESSVLKRIGGKYVLYQGEFEAFDAVLKGGIEAFLYDENTLRYYKDNDYRDKISVYPTRSRRFIFAFGLPKDSPLRGDVDYALLHFMEGPGWTFLLKRYGLEQNFT
jgi:ABC-type amino acid transport substrate-binding protein